MKKGVVLLLFKLTLLMVLQILIAKRDEYEYTIFQINCQVAVWCHHNKQ